MRSETLTANDDSLRVEMKRMLALCTEHQQFIFGKMYNHKNEHSNHVDGVKSEQMDWAFQQIERTLKENGPKEAS